MAEQNAASAPAGRPANPKREPGTTAKAPRARKATSADPARQSAPASAATKARAAGPRTAARSRTGESSVALGAARASGERKRRRSTPLLETPVSGAEASRAASPVDAPEGAARPARSTHRPVPRVTSSASSKARRQTGERRGGSDASGSRPRRSPREKRLADDQVRSHLRVAPAPGEPIKPPALDPVATAAGRSLAQPRWEEIVHAAIAIMRGAAQAAGLSGEDVEQRIAQVLAFVRRRIEGDYRVDDFGYDEDFTENVILPMLRPVYRHWFRVEVRGAENIPAEGAALIVANHSGTVAIDGLMTTVAIHDETPTHRVMRALGANLVFDTPVLGTWARRGGATLATNADADRLLGKGELVGVFPEGFKGVGKPFKERYKLQRFGRGGFVSSALKAEVPIIPCSIVGAEEIAPIIGNMGLVARLVGAPYMPITPTFPWLGPLGLIPLPSKWIIEFGAPIRTDTFGSAAADDPMLVFDLTDQVREVIQQTLYSLLMQRRSVFF